MISRAADLLLGKRVAVPDHLPPGAVPGGITLRTGTLIPRLGAILGRMSGSAAAVTLGRTIVIRPDVRLTLPLLAHELTHVRQWEEDALFPVRYAFATLRYGYHDNPYEVEARSVALAASSTTPHPQTG